MTRPKLLDTFCCQGGASMGYHRAGFDVTGVDIAPQPRYPFSFVQGDAVAYIRDHGHEYDAIVGSPPCQAHTMAQRIMGREHPDFIDATRDAMIDSGKPWIIENVPGAPLKDPVVLCGAMFPELRVYRHRLFEASFTLTVPDHPAHTAKVTKMGRAPIEGQYMHVVGNFSGVQQAREAMGGVDWMNRDGLRESIPPAYTEYLGAQLMEAL